MFRKVVILSAFVGILVAYPQAPNQRNNQPRNNAPRNNQGRQDAYNAKILHEQNDNTGTGNFDWGFETDLPQTFETQGRFIKVAPNQVAGLDVKGSWSYTDTDNKHVAVNYTSGTNGYRETRTYT